MRGGWWSVTATVLQGVCTLHQTDSLPEHTIVQGDHMYGTFTSARIPRAHIDPIVTSHGAQLMLDDIIARPRRHETVAILLDDDRRGVSIISVDGTVEPDAVFHVADLLTESVSASSGVGAVILASIRPDGHDELDDLDRWSELSCQLDEVGLELVEWFVIGHGMSCPRALLGEPHRWTP